MESLIIKFRGLLDSVSSPFVRSLADRVNWKARAISIEGARGVGKSTLMLQCIQKNLSVAKTLYLTLDDFYFRQNTLSSVAEAFYQNGGRNLFLDEVHKYPDWQTEVKNIYDFFPQLKLVISGSSILALQKSSADLSRRVVKYHLPPLSFREYLALEYQIELPIYELSNILLDHEEIASSLLKKLSSPLAKFRHYLQYGFYPFFKEGETDYHTRINQLINVIIDYDLPEAKPLEIGSLGKLKKLLYVISRSVPFKPNIQKLAEDIPSSRGRLLELIDILEKAQLIRNLRSGVSGVSLMNKPDKIFLNNPNVIYALADEKPEKGNVRETAFMAMVQDAGVSIKYSSVGDFLIDDKYTIEVGGKDKSFRQIKTTKNAFIVVDDLERGATNKIPLWLFGFLY